MSRLQERLARALGDRYAVERELGRGGMAIVYLADDLRHDRKVALKVLKPEVAETLGAERFLREIEIAARLNHPRIVPLLDSGEADGLLFYVMTYVEGESLRERLNREKQLPVEDAVEIARQVAAALAFAHDRGVVHRDVKPANVLLTAGEAVVADFGIARAVTAAGGTRLTESGVAVGTPSYMSPEQAGGERDLGPRSDIYGLGCLLYEMLAGEPPFTGPTAQAVMARKLSESAPDVTVVREMVPAGVAATVRRALAPVAADRHATATDFARKLRGAFTPPRGVSAGEPGDAGGPVVSRRSLILGAAGAGVLGFAGGATLPLSGGSRRSLTYHRLTFQRGMIRTARFGPDYQTILYGALWRGDVCRVYRVRPDSPESFPMDLPPATPLAISSRGEIALALGTHVRGVIPYGTLARVPLAGGTPRDLAEEVSFADWSPDGSELAVVRRAGGSDRLEFPLGHVVAEPSTGGGGFSFPRVSPDGDRVAIFELTTAGGLIGRVVTVDRSGDKVLVTPDYYDNVFGLSWNDDEIWFTAASERPLFRNEIHAVRPGGTPRVAARIPGNASLHDISPDARVLIARTDDRGGISFRGPGEARERDLSWLDNSDLAAISPDGATILFSEAGVGGGPERSVYVRDTDGSPPVRLGEGDALDLSPDGRWAIVREYTPGVPDAHLDLLPTGAGRAGRIEHPGLTYFSALWLPDGERVIVRAREGDGELRLYLQELGGGAIEAITPEGIAERDWALSPDGTMLAVVSERGAELYPVDGGEPRPVPGSAEIGSLLAWIDGGLLVPEDPGAVVSENRYRIARIDPSTGRRESWGEIAPRDPAGIMAMPQGFRANADGSAYGYSWHRALSDLYLVEGLA